MQLTYNQKYTYNILCDIKGLCGVCYKVTTIDVFGDNVYLSSSSSTEEIPLDKMKKIIQDLKKE